MKKQLWWNKEILPNGHEPQRSITLWLPSFWPVLDLPTKIGYTGVVENHDWPYIFDKTYYFVILGFGFSYNINWDE